MQIHKNRILLKDYGIFFDGCKYGYNDVSSGTVFCENGLMYMAFPHNISYDYVEDDQAGTHSYITQSADNGRTWTIPEPFGPPVVKNPQRESLILGFSGPTSKGTVFSIGFHQVLGEKAVRIHDDPSLRPYTLLIGRKEKGENEFTYTYYPSGAFLKEQFMERGMQLPSGRLVYEMWGMRERGENWRCGVLISDDDGVSWKYRDVGYEPDPAIRDNAAVPAGYNEQSLFLTNSGRIVSLIRGREKLGRVENSPKDTWFFRSVSEDGGETWSKPELTDIPGTGAAGVGIALPDGSIIHACRIPYSRDIYKLPEPELHGLHFARSFDEGRTWETEAFIQRDPEGNPFTYHYNAMNGQFLQTGEREFIYIFGHFGYLEKMYRVLAVRLCIED